MYDIRFPHLGIVLHNLKDGITIFGVEIKFYGIIITLGFVLAYLICVKEAKRTGQDEELYLDFLLWLAIPSIIGARLYYVLFSLDEYFQPGKGFWKTFVDIINIRNGGLAIYGGVIAGIIVGIIFAKKKKVNFFLMADTVCLGLVIAQAIGRWGNFFNREAYGEYTDSLFAMCIPADYYINNGSIGSLVNAGVITEKIAQNTVVYDSMTWISVHPTFLYESLWNIGLFILLMIYRKHKKFDGELALLYLWGYGLGRVWIEGLRTDSLYIPGIHLRISQLIAGACVLVAAALIVKKRMDYAKSVVDVNKK